MYSRERANSLEYLALMREGVDKNYKAIEDMKREHPEMPEEFFGYLDATAKAINDLLGTLTTAHDTILELQDALLKEREKRL